MADTTEPLAVDPSDGEKPKPPKAKKPRVRKRQRKRCGAKKRNGETCQTWAVKGRERCRMHGGTVQRGMESANFKAGRRSKYLPDHLRALHEEAHGDPDLAKIRTNIILIETLITSHMERMKDGRPVPEHMERRLVNLVGEQRKLAESEVRRLKDLQQMIPGERVGQLMRLTASIFVDELRALAAAHGFDPVPIQRRIRDRFNRAIANLPTYGLMEGEEGDPE